MGDRGHDVDSIRLRKCCHHVYENLIHFREDITSPSIEADDSRPPCSRQAHEIPSSPPPRLQCLVANELPSSRAQLETSTVESVGSNSSPVLLVESRSSDPPQVQETTSSSPPPGDESIINTSPALVDEFAASDPPPQAETSTSCSAPQVDEKKFTSPASVDESRSSNLPEAASSNPEEEAEARTSTSQRRPLGEYFVTGYAVRDRKPDRHVPVLNTTSSKDDPRLASFDVFDEIGEVGHVRDTFWPQPGDILVLQSHRSGTPYPGFDGHVELYVDEHYFQNPDYTWDWAYDFREGDILIRFGTFSTHWRWIPEESVQVYLRLDDCFILVGREVNHELSPLDFKFSNPALRPIHSIQVDFHPRLGDLIVRKHSARPFNWTLFWWKEAFYVSEPFDMLVRPGFVNSDDNIHCFSVVEVYFRNARNQHWSFQGRDDYTFGGGT